MDESGCRIAVMNLQEFFRDSVQQAMQHQHVKVDAHTEHYLVSLLARFAHASELHEGQDKSRTPRPLAFLLADAVAAGDPIEQRERMQKLGDVSLFMAGFFAQSFARRLVDIDYCIAMGGRAYGCLADSWRGRARGAAFASLFAELAAKFQRLVDVLNEVADNARPASDPDVLRLYEIWQKTGSPRALRQLDRRGITPVPAPGRA
jgi:hypothetical protein